MRGCGPLLHAVNNNVDSNMAGTSGFTTGYNKPVVMQVARPEPSVYVIVPARNEQDSIARCLESLLQQQGIGFQITVVDDGSTDQTRAIAESFPAVRVISAAQAAPDIIGKCNALICGAAGSQAEWLLFTDADTVHYPGSLAAAVKEANQRRVDLLSYSPQQEVVTWAEKALMPVVFAELARRYPPSRVNDPTDPIAAANGQYILVRRAAYEQLGGHRVVADQVLEDVALARLFKSAGHKIWFRHGAGLVKTRMYRTFPAMIEGWSKNLALLFVHPILLALVSALEFLFIVLTFGLAGAIISHHHEAGFSLLLFGSLSYLIFFKRIVAAHFSWQANVLAIFGLPLFSFLLLRSYLHVRVRGAVSWKGRIYKHAETRAGLDSSIK